MKPFYPKYDQSHFYIEDGVVRHGIWSDTEYDIERAKKFGCYRTRKKADGVLKTLNMVRMYNEGQTLQQIGNRYNITREAVRLRLEKANTKRRGKGTYAKYNLITFNCEQCYNPTTKRDNPTFRNSKHHFCGRTCLNAWLLEHRKSPEEILKRKAEYAKAYYRTERGRAIKLSVKERYEKSDKYKEWFKRWYEKRHNVGMRGKYDRSKMKNKRIKLYELPRDKGIRIKAETSNEHGKIGDFIIFHHLDGMYSYCTEEKTGAVVHLYANTELIYKIKEGYYEIV